MPFSGILAAVMLLAVFAPARAASARPQDHQDHPPSAPPSAPSSPSSAQASPPAPAPPPALPKHTVTLRFDYDFDRTPACSTTPKTPCVARFVVYDISGGLKPSRRAQLFIIPVPPNAKGAVQGITATSPPLPFERGKHWIGISAQMADNKTESFPSKCAVWVKIP